MPMWDATSNLWLNQWRDASQGIMDSWSKLQVRAVNTNLHLWARVGSDSAWPQVTCAKGKRCRVFNARTIPESTVESGWNDAAWLLDGDLILRFTFSQLTRSFFFLLICFSGVETFPVLDDIYCSKWISIYYSAQGIPRTTKKQSQHRTYCLHCEKLEQEQVQRERVERYPPSTIYITLINILL